MKKTKKNLSIIAMVAIIGFGFTACDPGDDGGGKSDGAAVSAPTLNAKTQTSITVNAVTAPDNGQTVEYGRNTANSAPSTWQDGLTFSSLTAETMYYIFARSKENSDFNAGTPSASLEVITHVHNWNWATYVTGSGLRECQDASCTITAGFGDTGPAGGIIFFMTEYDLPIYGDTITFETYPVNYLEAAPFNQAEDITWSLTNISSNTVNDIGYGRRNTAHIIQYNAGDTVSNNAAKAANITIGGKSDWFLPSKEELQAMYNYRTDLGISSGIFWSSSEVGDSSHALSQNFATGAQNQSAKNENRIVRAIRAF